MAFSQSKDVTPSKQEKPKLHEQQLEIIHCPARFVVGQAFAGTGKSTTGIAYAWAHPKERVLVLCFNKANAAEAQGKYPKANTAVSTTHGLAYRSLSEKQRSRLSHRWSPVTIREELTYVGGRSNYQNAAIVHSILNEFFVSADPSIDPDKHGLAAMTSLHAAPSEVSYAASLAEKLWAAMQSDEVTPGLTIQVNAVSIPHDAYLKQYILSNPDIPFGTIIFDEAQDCNPVMLDFLMRQYEKGVKIIMLGDRHQAIYEFRGAINAMEVLPSEAVVLPLTQSWRFGPKTADIANFILHELKGETLEITGRGKDSVYKEGAPIAYLSRTNADILQRAVSMGGEGVHWVGGIDGYRVGMLNDAWMLRCGRNDLIQDPQMKRHFRSWSEFAEAAKYDDESKIVAGLVESYNASTAEVVDLLRKNAVQDMNQATTVLTTAHKSKGLEWPFVRLADDYKGVFKQAESWLSEKSERPFPEQEVNLLYVASTRALHELTPNKEMNEWFDNIDQYRRRRVRDFTRAEAGSKTPAPSSARSRKNAAFAGIAPIPMF